MRRRGYTGVESTPYMNPSIGCHCHCYCYCTYKPFGKRSLLRTMIDQIEKTKHQTCARVKYPLRVIRCQFSYTKAHLLRGEEHGPIGHANCPVELMDDAEPTAQVRRGASVMGQPPLECP